MARGASSPRGRRCPRLCGICGGLAGILAAAAAVLVGLFLRFTPSELSFVERLVGASTEGLYYGLGGDGARTLRNPVALERLRASQAVARPVDMPVMAHEVPVTPSASTPPPPHLDWRFFLPANATGAARPGGAPVLLWFHGGGFVCGAPEYEASWARVLAHESGLPVLTLGYRLAPEHPFPTPFEDAVAAVRWALAQLPSCCGGDPSLAILGGTSAGGNLAAAVALELGSEEPRPAALLLAHPVLREPRDSPSYRKYARGYLLTDELMRDFWGMYGGRSDDRRTAPLAATAEELARSPPTVLVAGEHEVLVDEMDEYCAKLRGAGVRTWCHTIPGSIHAAFGRTPFTGALDGVRAAATELHAVLGLRPASPTGE